jgi:Ni/Fe-hydrogenase subunit HybB-like protein
MKFKITFWKALFVIIMILGAYSAYVRYFHGLGAVSNMSDQFPWGLWIGFDCLCGIMLAAGGFCISGAVYLFNVERLHVIVRPVILTAFHRRPIVRSGASVVHLAPAHLHEPAFRDV